MAPDTEEHIPNWRLYLLFLKTLDDASWMPSKKRMKQALLDVVILSETKDLAKPWHFNLGTDPLPLDHGDRLIEATAITIGPSKV